MHPCKTETRGHPCNSHLSVGAYISSHLLYNAKLLLEITLLLPNTHNPLDLHQDVPLVLCTSKLIVRGPVRISCVSPVPLEVRRTLDSRNCCYRHHVGAGNQPRVLGKQRLGVSELLCPPSSHDFPSIPPTSVWKDSSYVLVCLCVC